MPEKSKGPIDPVDQFKARLLKATPGQSVIYHRGVIARDRVDRPSINMIAILAHGLQMLNRVSLSQKRIMENHYEYRLRVLRPIRNVDFDHGRKTYLESLEEE